MDAIDISKMKHANDFEYAIQITRWLLKPLGIWSLGASSKLETVFQFMLMVCCSFLQAFITVPLYLQMFLVPADLGVKLKMIGIILFSTLNVVKYFAMILRHGTVGSCILGMAKDWHEIEGIKQRNILIGNATKARYITSFCILLLYSCAFLWCIVLPMHKGAIVVGNVSYHRLPYPAYFAFFDPRIRPVWDFVFIFQCFAGFVRYTVSAGVCGFAILCFTHISSVCKITCMKLHNLSNNLHDRNILGNIVTQHLRCLRFVSTMEKLLNDVLLIETFGCTLNICMLGYYVITAFEKFEKLDLITYFLMITVLIYQTFILCYTGNLLTDKCRNVGEAAYAIDWYKFPSNSAKNIIFIIVISQRPVGVTAGKMFYLSIRSFCNIMKASATYLNLLRTVTENI